MSTSTDALLVYGYIWDDEIDLIDPGKKWTDILLAKRGVVDPYESYPGPNAPSHDTPERARTKWLAQNRAAIDAWLKSKSDLELEYGVAIAHHGSGEWRVPIVCITDWFCANRGYPIKLTSESLTVQTGWNAQLQRFLTDLEIDTSAAQGPAWWLCSWRD